MKWLNQIPWLFLIIMAVLLGLAPAFSGGQPHLIEKIQLLWAGQLNRPIDIFDLILHASPFILICLKVLAWSKNR